MVDVKRLSDKIKEEVFTVFKGKEETVNKILAGFYAGGHVLLEDVPGTGKTILAKTLSKALNLPFSRVQCTPDLMPSDIIGNSIWDISKQQFEFRKGPIMSSIVLVDELNRATPRTQSALLEAMAEKQITVDGNNYPLNNPFFVIATENPIESEGTFPLPEAQKDRFIITLSIGYPSEDEEKEILISQRSTVHPIENVKAVTNQEELLQIIEQVVSIHVDNVVLEYLMEFVKATRNDKRIQTGVSPRGSLALYKASQAYAAIQGRDFVTPEDVKALVMPVFRNRIILTPDSVIRGISEESVINDLILNTAIPDFKVHS